MLHPYALHNLAREHQHEALEAARASYRLRLARDPLFNHYHYWPAAKAYQQQEGALEAERAWRLLRGRGWLERLAVAFDQGARWLKAYLVRDGNPDGGAAALSYSRRPRWLRP